ncbi:N-acetylmuramoyl-L-alanine amidase family protein [Euzebyella saccharophila]|uniref:N-acetylmuramoyl-L-alanine amidase n=1 Tax=Euzebyella saccharophila TaxID=679664 RepID=A0ABV8JJY8_9FLAO|nr:N-acetylmuramoyl-L-alanine amidase [Euzebyella saccharophila]
MIIIDPGHGGFDSGAIGINGLKEKDVVFDIAKEVVRLNRELFNDSLEIYLTRYSDTFISLGDRTKLAKALKADVFVSIHCNQTVRKAAQGIEVYVKQRESRSEYLAEQFAIGLHEKLGFKNRGVKYANFQVLRETTQCPSVLLELGFLSNWEEASYMLKASTISGYAILILETLMNFLGYD